MRKFFLLAALVLGLAACQNDLDGVNSAPKGEVARLCVSLPDVATRAAAGSEVGGLGHFDPNTMDIRYILEVYNEDGTALVKARDIILSDNGSVAFELNLIPNRNYQFVVWADFVANGSKADNYYNTAAGLREIALNENAWTAMNESRDAYTGVKKVEGYNSRSEINLQLTRPFGKLRVVTNDLDKLNTGVTPKSVKVTYKANVNSTFDAFTEKVIADTYAAANKEFSYNLADVTAYGDKTNQQTLFVDYLFGVEDGTIQFLMDIDYSDSGSTTKLNFNTEIPIERNKLTTILGSLLTDGNKFDVSIDDDFDNGTEWNPGDDEYDVEIWDGKTLNAPVDSDGDGIYEIGTGSQLGYLAAATNGTLPSTLATRAGEVNWAKQKFVLTQDIDLGGHEWTPIGRNTDIYFEGSFDGNNHTIKGLNITKYSGQNAHALFGGVAGKATFKNLVIDGANIVNPANNEGDFYAAGLIGSYYGTLTIENVTVKNSTFVGNNKVAGLVAHDAANSSINVNNCHVYKCTIKTNNEADGGNVAGMLGLFQGDANKENKISNSSVKECTIVAINSANKGKRANSQFVGGTISKANQTLVIENCSVENNTYTETFVHAEGVADYVGGYDNKFVGGDREDMYLGVVIINGTRYEGAEETKNVSANGEYYATINDALTAIDSTEVEITLGEGEHVMPKTSADNKNITIVGVNKEDTVIKVGESGTSYHKGCSINFENVTVTRKAGLAYEEGKMDGFAYAKQENYTNCIINGCVRLMVSESATFTNCEFRNTVKSGFDGYSIHYYSSTGSKVSVNNCTFNTVSKGICIYSEGVNDYYLEVNDCTFTASEKDDKAAIQMHTEYGITGIVKINNTTATGFADVNGGLWNELNNQTKVATNNFDIIVDGVIVKRGGYTEVANYPGLFTKDGEYYVFNAEGLMSLNHYFEANKYAHATFDTTYNIAADIDATGCTWNKVHLNVPNNDKNGFVINGHENTISNLTINGSMFMYTACGANDDAQAGEVKNLTFDNATVTGGYHTAVVWGCLTNDLKLTNVHVLNSNITGTCNVGGLIGSTGEGSKYEITFDGCSVKNTKITATGENVDPTGASGFIGRALNDTTIKFVGSNVINDNTITNNNGLVGGNVYGYVAHKNGAFIYPGFSDEFTNWAGFDPVEIAPGVLKTNDYIGD